jgi:hypothetical protein
VLRAKLEISLTLTAQFMDLERQMNERPDLFAATKSYQPYMESDQLFLAMGTEITDLDESIDLHNMRVNEQMVKDGKLEVTQGQFEYLKLVNWYQEQLEKMKAQF